MPRVELNAQAPDFSLKDFRGNDLSLSEFLSKKNVIVVFNRGFM